MTTAHEWVIEGFDIDWMVVAEQTLYLVSGNTSPFNWMMGMMEFLLLFRRDRSSKVVPQGKGTSALR